MSAAIAWWGTPMSQGAMLGDQPCSVAVEATSRWAPPTTRPSISTANKGVPSGGGPESRRLLAPRQAMPRCEGKWFAKRSFSFAAPVQWWPRFLGARLVVGVLARASGLSDRRAPPQKTDNTASSSKPDTRIAHSAGQQNIVLSACPAFDVSVLCQATLTAFAHRESRWRTGQKQQVALVVAHLVKLAPWR